ncbi:hypothetical protein MUP59_11630 [Candidatus Bathyarchaeota archaeon]|nr:hypothetical protein [Candidatus Bathyarchaeota archaeon]
MRKPTQQDFARARRAKTAWCLINNVPTQVRIGTKFEYTDWEFYKELCNSHRYGTITGFLWSGLAETKETGRNWSRFSISPHAINRIVKY